MAFKLNLGVLQVTIGADTGPLKDAEREVKRTSKNMGKSFLSLGKIISGVLAGVAIKNTILLADKMNMLDQQIKNVVRNAESFTKIREGIRSIAAETGNSIESVTKLAQALIIAGESIGTTDEQTVEMISNLNKLGIIGGSSGEAMGNSMRQFGQAMTGGIVRAEEFNSIIENTPLIAKAIADGMNLTTGELRKQVIEGKVLSEEVFRALQGQTEEINKQFAAIPMTIDRASGLISNAFATAIQDLDNGVGLTTDIADSMADLADIIGDDVVPFVDDIVDNFIDLIEYLDETTQMTQDMAGDLADSADEALGLADAWEFVKTTASNFITFLKEFPIHIRNITTIMIGEFDKAWTTVKSGFETLTTFIEFGLESAFQTAITKVRVIWNDFISFGQRGLANLFAVFGENAISESIRQTAEETAEIGADLNAILAEQQAERDEQLAAELLSIEENLIAKTEAVDSIILSGIKETDALKIEIERRRKIRKQERKDRRNTTKETTKESVEVKKILSKSLAEQLKDIKAYGQASDTLAKAGIISEKANAAIQIGVSAATAVAKTAELGFPQALPFIAQALATIANAKQMLSGAGREFGGSATAGLPIPVNEGGPEMFVGNSGRQFLLPDQSGKVVPLGKGGSNSGGGVKIIINNNAPGVEVTQTMSNGDIILAIEQAEQNAINAINSSLAAGRGETAEALRSGFNQTRNI